MTEGVNGFTKQPAAYGGNLEGTPSLAPIAQPLSTTSSISSLCDSYDCCGCIALLKAVADFIARPFINIYNRLMKWLGFTKEPESLQSLPNAGKVTLPADMVGVIASYCWKASDIKGLSALACAGRSLNRVVTQYTETIIDLDKWLPRNFVVIDTGADINNQPDIARLVAELGIKKLAVLKCWVDLAPHVRKDAGVSFLVMRKGCAYESLHGTARNDGMTIDIHSVAYVFWRRVPVDHTYAVMITNNVFINTREMTFGLFDRLPHVTPDHEQKRIVVQQRCEMPIFVEYVALCVFARKRLPECPYGLGKVERYGLRSITYAVSSTCVDGYPLIIGNCTQDKLFVQRCTESDLTNGHGGRRILASSNQTKSFWSFLGF